VIPATRKPYDVREVIARIVDGSRFDEFKARYGTTLVTGFARLHGMPVGIVANNGILFGESAQKGAHFIELCAQRGIPLLFLQNITGFMVGRKYENGRHRQGRRQDGDRRGHRAGAQVHGADRRQLRRRQLRHVRPRLQPALPVDVAQRAHLVMGGEQAASVLSTIKRDGMEAKGGVEQGGGGGLQGADPRPVRNQGHPYYATARLWDDGILDPAQTRRVLPSTMR
jgi:3-methylcrotonyl-CoA carboxylase beta subunit